MKRLFVGLVILLFYLSGCKIDQSDSNTLTDHTDTLTRVSLGIIPKKNDTLYIDFVLEDTLKNGYRFGMTLTEWNKQLALLTKEGKIAELQEVSSKDYAGDLEQYWGYQSYKGFTPIYTGDSNKVGSYRIGTFVTGLFLRPKQKLDSIQVFRRNNTMINEPVLIGIKKFWNIPSTDIIDVVDGIIYKDELNYVVGSTLSTLAFTPPGAADFESSVGYAKAGEAFIKFAKGDKHITKYEDDLTNESTYKTLFQNKRFYCVIKIKEVETAHVRWNTDYKITSVTNARRDYQLTQEIYSKQQAKINVADYMTWEQRRNHENLIKSNELMNKALKK